MKTKSGIVVKANYLWSQKSKFQVKEFKFYIAGLEFFK